MIYKRLNGFQIMMHGGNLNWKGVSVMMKVNKNKEKNQTSVYLDHELMKDVEENVDISLVDVSDEGIGIKTKEPMKREKLISFNLCFTRTIYRVVAKVLWTKKVGALYESGLEVEYMPEELLEEIEDYMNGCKSSVLIN